MQSRGATNPAVQPIGLRLLGEFDPYFLRILRSPLNACEKPFANDWKMTQVGPTAVYDSTRLSFVDRRYSIHDSVDVPFKFERERFSFDNGNVRFPPGCDPHFSPEVFRFGKLGERVNF